MISDERLDQPSVVNNPNNPTTVLPANALDNPDNPDNSSTSSEESVVLRKKKKKKKHIIKKKRIKKHSSSSSDDDDDDDVSSDSDYKHKRKKRERESLKRKKNKNKKKYKKKYLKKRLKLRFKKREKKRVKREQGIEVSTDSSSSSSSSSLSSSSSSSSSSSVDKNTTHMPDSDPSSAQPLQISSSYLVNNPNRPSHRETHTHTGRESTNSRTQGRPLRERQRDREIREVKEHSFTGRTTPGYQSRVRDERAVRGGNVTPALSQARALMDRHHHPSYGYDKPGHPGRSVEGDRHREKGRRHRSEDLARVRKQIDAISQSHSHK